MRVLMVNRLGRGCSCDPTVGSVVLDGGKEAAAALPTGFATGVAHGEIPLPDGGAMALASWTGSLKAATEETRF